MAEPKKTREFIKIRGANENNLKHLDVDIPRNEFAVLTITDTGIGIPAEHQERIFERFYRVDKSHSKEIGGTGLGLSIVKHAAKLHNAEIELHSIVNKGTEITIKFPKN